LSQISTDVKTKSIDKQISYLRDQIKQALKSNNTQAIITYAEQIAELEKDRTFTLADLKTILDNTEAREYGRNTKDRTIRPNILLKSNTLAIINEIATITQITNHAQKVAKSTIIESALYHYLQIIKTLHKTPVYKFNEKVLLEEAKKLRKLEEHNLELCPHKQGEPGYNDWINKLRSRVKQSSYEQNTTLRHTAQYVEWFFNHTQY